MWPLVVYVGLVLGLFVRFQNARVERRPVHWRGAPKELRLVRRQHRIFYALLLAAPLEWWLRARPAGRAQIAGSLLFLGGLVGYRWAGRVLGEQLTPLVAPREPARLVEGGPYRRIRHPMYLGELAMAFGAVLTLAAYGSAVLAVAFAVVVLHRVVIEERVLRARLPGYQAYATRTNRILPYVY